MMAKPTRDEVVKRALDMFDKCGYIWGGYPGTQTPCQMNDNGDGETGGGSLYATDCSGYASWAWGLGYHANSSYWGPNGTFSGNYRKREAYTGVIEQDFPGIQPGDVLWKNGHVIIYIGNNTTLEASTQHWTNTETKTGMVRRTGSRGDMLGYCSYDGTFSADYDGSEDITEWSPQEGTDDPSKQQWEDDDGYYVSYLYLEDRYTKRYEIMRHWRTVK